MTAPVSPTERAAVLNALADKVEKLTEPCRETDLAVYLARHPGSDIAKMVTGNRRGLDGREGLAWDIRINAVVFERFDHRGNCPFNGGIPLPAFSASLDAAVTLVLASMDWEVRTAKLMDICQAQVIETHDRHKAEAKTAALALTAAALRAAASQETARAVLATEGGERK